MWSNSDILYYFYILLGDLIINQSKNTEITYSRDYYNNSLIILLSSFQLKNYINTSKKSIY